MKRVITVLLLILVGCSFFVSPVAHAQPVKPHNGIHCFADSCDGLLPHETDGGSACTSHGLHQIFGPVELVDANGLTEGKLYLFGSYGATGACNTYWATVYSTTTYMTNFSDNTIRYNDNDDSTYKIIDYLWPNYCHLCWNDSAMFGMDSESPQDCIQGETAWTDRFGQVRVADTKSICD